MREFIYNIFKSLSDAKKFRRVSTKQTQALKLVGINSNSNKHDLSKDINYFK